MNGFDNREKGFEGMFSHDEGIRFRVHARQVKLFGLWLGTQMGLPVDEAYMIGKDLAQSQLAKPGFEALLTQAEALLKTADKSIVRHALATQLKHFGAKAYEQITQEVELKS